MSKKLSKKAKAAERAALNSDKNRNWDDEPKVLQQSREQIQKNQLDALFVQFGMVDPAMI